MLARGTFGAGLNCSEIEVLLALLRTGRRMAEQRRAFPPTNVRDGSIVLQKSENAG